MFYTFTLPPCEITGRRDTRGEVGGGAVILTVIHVVSAGLTRSRMSVCHLCVCASVGSSLFLSFPDKLLTFNIVTFQNTPGLSGGRFDTYKHFLYIYIYFFLLLFFKLSTFFFLLRFCVFLAT